MGITMTPVRLKTLKQKKDKDTGLFKSEEDFLTASKLQLPKEYLSPSQIEMFLRCPHQYEERYINGKKSPPGVALVEGSSHHAALEYNNNYKKKSGRDQTPKKMYSRFADAFSDKKKEIEDWDGDKEENVLTRGKSIINNYMEDFAPDLSPDMVECEVRTKVGPVPLFGILDVDGEYKKKTIVGDYKTVKQKKSAAALNSSIQLTFYHLGEREDLEYTGPLEVGFINLMKTSGAVVPQFVTVTEGRIRWFRQLVLNVANQISLGNFGYTLPDNWCCSSRFCGYWKDCRGKYES